MNEVIFDEKANSYSFNGIPYERVTKMLKLYEVPFDRMGISLRMAEKEAGRGGDVQKVQNRILKEWDQAGTSASDHGTRMHSICEEYLMYGTENKEYPKLMEDLRILVRPYSKIFSEQIFYYHTAKLAGRGDLKCNRQRGKNTISDYYDFKTNIRNGIKFDSTRVKNGVLQHTNKMMLPPIDHLEDCNYVKYALQLSVYAWMDEMESGAKPGRLAIVYLNHENNVTKNSVNLNDDYTLQVIPVAYLKRDVEIMMMHYMNRHIFKKEEIPQQKKITEEEDW